MLFLGPAGLVAMGDDIASTRTSTSTNNTGGGGTGCTADLNHVPAFLEIPHLVPQPMPSAAFTKLEPGVGAGLDGITFGSPVEFAPLYYFDEPASGNTSSGTIGNGTVVLGRYTHSNKPSLVAHVSAVRGCKVVYSGAPALPAALLRTFAEDAGVHMYVGTSHIGDAIAAAGNSLMVHASDVGGTRHVMLPVRLVSLLFSLFSSLFLFLLFFILWRIVCRISGWCTGSWCRSCTPKKLQHHTARVS
jgi:hypothetical protein